MLCYNLTAQQFVISRNQFIIHVEKGIPAIYAEMPWNVGIFQRLTGAITVAVRAGRYRLRRLPWPSWLQVLIGSRFTRP